MSAPLVLRGDRIVLSARDAQRAVGTYETGPLSNWYVEYMADALDAVFRALSDPTRRAILERLRTSDATVGELAEPFAMTVQAVSRHLKVLEAAGLVTRGREAQWRTSSLDPRPLRDAAAWLAAFERFWAPRPDGRSPDPLNPLSPLPGTPVGNRAPGAPPGRGWPLWGVSGPPAPRGDRGSA